VYDLHRAQGDEEQKFLGLASKPRSTVSPGFASKSVATVLVVWPKKHSLGFSGLVLKIGNCGLVIWPTKSLRQFLGYSLSVAPQNQREDEDGAGHALGSSGLLHLKVSRARVSQFYLKTGGGATVGDACRIITEVTWK
jgi:hypothetical protein